jgi:alkylation response protein AidB-like acyl-CoA dehydrogenase
MNPDTHEFAELCERIAGAAAERDRDGADLASEIDWLRQAGLLRAALPAVLSGQHGWSDDPLAVAAMLRAIGQASLPVARLFEGHINAAQLIGVNGSAPLQRRVAVLVERGALLGVWGADGPNPLLARRDAGGVHLSGAKIFCSGLGIVAMALVSTGLDGHTLLLCVEADDPARADPAQWQVSGMRATRSGGYDFTGLVVPAEAVVGAPDSYYDEPWFLGGMYRMCAAQVGGLDALLNATVAACRDRGKAADPLAQLRVGEVASLRAMAAAVTWDVARRLAETPQADGLAHAAVLMREGVERCVVETLALVERTLGTELHRETSVLSRVRRDLSFYIRQAVVDARLIMVGKGLLNGAP